MKIGFFDGLVLKNGDEKMEQRVIRREHDGHWRIQTPSLRAVPEEEQRKLKSYFDEIRFNYRIINGEVFIDGSMPWGVIDEIMQHFYDGWAELIPF